MAGLDDEALDTQEYLLRRVIVCLEDNKVLSAIKAAIAYAESKKDKAKVKEFEKFLQGDTPRLIAKLDVVKSDAALAFEYYDKDREGDPYRYEAETEKIIRSIERCLYLYVGKVLSEQGNDIRKILKGM